MERFFRVFDEISYTFAKVFRGFTTDHCPMVTAIDQHTFITESSDLITVFKLNGRYSSMGAEGLAANGERLSIILSTLLNSPLHSVQFIYDKEKSQSKKKLSELTDSNKFSAEKIGLDTEISEHFINESVDTICNYVAEESGYLVLYTYMKGLSRRELQEERKRIDRKKSNAKKKTKKLFDLNSVGSFGQPPLATSHSLIHKHRNLARMILKEFQDNPMSLQLSMLEVHNAIYEIRKLVSPNQTSSKWSPYLPGDQIPMFSEPFKYGKFDNLYYPAIATQIFKHQPENINLSTVQIGEEFYKTLAIDLMPKQPSLFNKLVDAIPEDIEWRASLHLIGGHKKHLSKLKTVKGLAQFCRFFRPLNWEYHDDIIDGSKNLIKIASEEALCGLKVHITVKGKTEDEVEQNFNSVLQVTQNWGECDTIEIVGDPFDAYCSTLPGFDLNTYGRAIVAPLTDIIPLLPIDRPCSPWEKPDLLFRVGSKVFPYSPVSDLQRAIIDIYVGDMGGGKSVLMNQINRAICFTSGLVKLPKVGVLDIGPSSQGFITSIKAALPSSRHGEVVHLQLKNRRDNAINVFDLPVGFSRPTTYHAEFLKNFLTLLFTPNNTGKPKEYTSEISAMLVNELYEEAMFNPVEYQPNLCPQIADLLDSKPFLHKHAENFASERKGKKAKLSWIDIVKALIDEGLFIEAGIAQKYAVPTIKDIPRLLNSSKTINDFLGNLESGKQLRSHLEMMIQNAVDEYRLLTDVSQLNLSQARIIALDLQAVAVKENKKKTALMYMLGRHIVGGDFYFSKDDLRIFDEDSAIYRYHEKKILEDASQIKRLTYDELHRISGLEAINNQLKLDVRETRKFKVSIGMASQKLSDIPQEVIDLASNIFSLTPQNESVAKETANIIGLNKSEKYHLQYDVKGATKHGAIFMWRCKLNNASFSRVTTNTVGPTALWADNTDSFDVSLRNYLLARLPYIEAIKLLAKSFKKGSAKDYMSLFMEESKMSRSQATEYVCETLLSTGSLPKTMERLT